MRNTKWTLYCLGLLMILAVACKETPTSITSVKMGKDKDATTETSTYAPGDTLYAVAAISSPGKIKVTGRPIVDEVEGQTKGPITSLEKTLDLAGSDTTTFTLTPPPAGWPKGKYSFEVVITDDAGAQKDKKSVNFTVS